MLTKSGQSRTCAYMETTVRSAWSFGVAETPDQQDLSHQAFSTRSGCAIHQVVAALSTFQCCSLPRIHLVHPLGSIRLQSHKKLITKKLSRRKSERFVDIRCCFVVAAKRACSPHAACTCTTERPRMPAMQQTRLHAWFAVAVYRNALQSFQVPDRLGEQTGIGMPCKNIQVHPRFSAQI